MMRKLRLALAGTVVLVVLAMTGTTGALWRDEASVSPETVTTGNLELLAGGEPVTFPFDALVANNLAPGDAISAPLTISNGGSTGLVYKLEGVTTSSADAMVPAPADDELALALTLLITDDATCDGKVAESGVSILYQGPLSTAVYTGSKLTSSSSLALCITVGLAEGTPATASSGAVSATFIFRGDQVL